MALWPVSAMSKDWKKSISTHCWDVPATFQTINMWPICWIPYRKVSITCTPPSLKHFFFTGLKNFVRQMITNWHPTTFMSTCPESCTNAAAKWTHCGTTLLLPGRKMARRRSLPSSANNVCNLDLEWWAVLTCKALHSQLQLWLLDMELTLLSRSWERPLKERKTP
jgi:hypothetical protein